MRLGCKTIDRWQPRRLRPGARPRDRQRPAGSRFSKRHRQPAEPDHYRGRPECRCGHMPRSQTATRRTKKHGARCAPYPSCSGQLVPLRESHQPPGDCSRDDARLSTFPPRKEFSDPVPVNDPPPRTPPHGMGLARRSQHQ